jgi:abortive infection bacteriophage resistance protein
MYSFLPQKIQSKIAKEFAYVNESDLLRMLDLLSRVRNVCAHNERLFDYQYYKGAINDTYMHVYLKITKKKGQFTKGKSDLFAALISLKYLLDEQDFQKMIDDINNCFNTLFTATNQIQSQQLFKYMGFPINWIEIKVGCINY